MTDLNDKLRAALESCITGGYTDVDGDAVKTYLFNEDLVAEALATLRATPAPQAAPSELTDEHIDEIARKHCLDGSMCAMPRHEYWRAFARYLLAAAPAVAITQAATSEPVQQTDLAKRLLAMAEQTGGRFGAISVLKADLVAICCEANRYYTGMMNWKSTAQAKDVAHLSGTTPNTEAPSDERAAFEAWLRSRWPNAQRPIDEKTDKGFYVFSENNLLWEVWQARAALSAQQAGVQEAPSEERSHYQVWMHGIGGWRDATKKEYDRARPEDRQCWAALSASSEAPSDAKLWSLIDAYADQRAEYQHSAARHLAKTQRENVEYAKAEVVAALSAQQAGVQEAPSEDAKEPDMLWCADDEEEYADSAEEFAKNYASNALRVGEVEDVDVYCAHRASPHKRTLRIGIVAGETEDADRVEWKWIERAALAAATQTEKK